MGSKKAAVAKKPSGAGGGGLPPWALSAASSAKWPAAYLLAIFVTFKWCLPFLAELTPPGVDLSLIHI